MSVSKTLAIRYSVSTEKVLATFKDSIWRI